MGRVVKNHTRVVKIVYPTAILRSAPRWRDLGRLLVFVLLAACTPPPSHPADRPKRSGSSPPPHQHGHEQPSENKDGFVESGGRQPPNPPPAPTGIRQERFDALRSAITASEESYQQRDEWLLQLAGRVAEMERVLQHHGLTTPRVDPDRCCDIDVTYTHQDGKWFVSGLHQPDCPNYIAPTTQAVPPKRGAA